jgi:protoporphyrinogen oxidase
LIAVDRGRFNDNWLYIHDPAVRVGRIQNYKAWSPDMVPDSRLCNYGLEYFCSCGDELWTASDPALVELAKNEIQLLGLATASELLDGCVFRQPKAYPVYDEGYTARVGVIRKELEDRFPTLHVTGRNGMHKYNNQDHSIMTAMLAVRNVLAGRKLYDPWRVNEDAEYHEERKEAEHSASGLRSVPQRIGTT